MKFNILTFAVFSLVLLISSVSAYNYEDVDVITRANITNAVPEILEVIVDEDITLNAGGVKTVYCNASIRDWNGWEDVIAVNGTFFYEPDSFSGDVDDGNLHYTNSSCEIYDNDGEYIAYSSCTFEVLHYANNGDWVCNVSAEDSFGFVDSLENETTINELYALNVTDTIDYGDLSVLDYSPDVLSSITNFGNVDINVSVLGYGVEEGDGLGLVCDEGSNITVENQRFSLDTDNLWEEKTALSSDYQDVGITLLQPTDATSPVESSLYWRLFVPPNPFGECVGTLRFTATVP